MQVCNFFFFNTKERKRFVPPSSAFQPFPASKAAPSGAPTPPRPRGGTGRSPHARRPAPEGARVPPHPHPAAALPASPGALMLLECGRRGPRVPGSLLGRRPGQGAGTQPSSRPEPPRPLTGQEREGQQQPVDDRAEHVPLHARGARGAGRGSLCRRGAKGTWRAGRLVARAAPRGQDPRLGGGDPNASAAAAACFSSCFCSASARGPPSPLRCQPCPAAERSARLWRLAEAEHGRTAAGRRAPAPPPAGLYKLGPPPALRGVPASALPRRPARPCQPSTPGSPVATRPGKRLGTAARRARGGGPRPRRGCPALGFPGSTPRATAPRVAGATFALLQHT